MIRSRIIQHSVRWIIICLMAMVWACNPYSKVTSFDRTIEFSGIKWKVKKGSERVGPGPNWFSNSPDNVWVDEYGNLHLKIRWEDDRWTCAEVVTKDYFAYGKYYFQIIGQLDELDPSVVLGLFTWSDKGDNNREVDIAFSTWGNSAARSNAQYVVQPAHIRGNRYRFPIRQEGSYTTHQFSWYPDFVNFYSYHGHVLANDQVATPIKFWVYPKKLRKPRKVNIRINLWLYKGNPPVGEEEVEIIIKKFHHEAI